MHSSNSSTDVSDKYKKFVAEKKKRCAELASGYTPQKRLLEKIMISIFLILFFISLFQIVSVAHFASSEDAQVGHTIRVVTQHDTLVSRSTVWLTIVVGFVLGMLSADFFSGCVHWFADTFCTKETAVLGPLIRSFREHHVDQQAITRHDVIESNGDNCMFGNLLLLAGRVTCLSLWWEVPVVPTVGALQMCGAVSGAISSMLGLAPNTNHTISLLSLFLLTWSTSFALMFALTNQIHKWSHQYSVPVWVKWLQDCRIILHRKDHMVHHTNPFDRYYCITTGWMNPVLSVTGFWRGLEFVIETCSGGSMKPRADDMKWTSHMKILEETPEIHHSHLTRPPSTSLPIHFQASSASPRPTFHISRATQSIRH